MVVRRKDVAQLAGVSPAVVSYVLNGGPRSVAPETRVRVLEAVERLGYRPNRIASALRMSRTQTLGLVVPDTSNPFFAELALAVEEAAFNAGYTVLLGNATESQARQTAYVRTFTDRRADGLLLVPAHGPVECVAELERSGTPWVVLDRRIENPMAPEVVVDNRAGAKVATEHLLAHGYRTIACVAGPPDVLTAHDRVAGWRDALEDAGVDATSVRQVPFGRRAGYRAALEILDGGPVPAIFAASDEQALGVLRAVTQRGLRCPEDVAIVSFDGIPASAYSTPGLTTMAQPFDELGRVGVARLQERMAQPDQAPPTTTLSVALVRRGSCGCPDTPGELD